MFTRHFVPALVLTLIVVLVSMSIWIIRQSYQSSPLEAINPEYERFIQLVDDNKRVQALKLGDSLFKRLFDQRPENPAVALLAQRLRVSKEISTLITSSVRPNQTKLLEGIPGMEDLKLSSTMHKDRATRTSLSPPAQRLYWTHLSTFTDKLALNNLPTQQAAFLDRYYDLQMQDSIMKVGRQLVMADPNSSENCCYALVLPLMYLSSRDDAWDQIEHFFTLFSPNQIDVMRRFSLLQAERPQISAWIAQCQAKIMGKVFSLAFWALDAADICIADHQPDLARLSLHIALDDTKNQSKVAELRLKIAESYARCGDYATAIQTCRQITDDLPNSTLYGRTMATYFSYLAKEANADQIVTETQSALRDIRCKSYLPQILYLRWWALCKVDRRAEAVMVAQRLMEQYPSNPLVAPFLLERATDALARQQYDRCHELLTKLTKDFPGTESAKRAEGILARFKGSEIKQGNGGFSASRTENRP